MALGRTAGNIISKGSHVATFRETTSLGSHTGTLVSMPIIKSTSLSDKVTYESQYDESGNKYQLADKTERSLDLQVMQKDVDTLTAMTQTYKDKYLTIVKAMTSTPNSGGKYLIGVFPIAQVLSEMEFKSPGAETPFKFNIVNNSSDIGVNLANYAHADFPVTLTGTVTVSANRGYLITEL